MGSVALATKFYQTATILRKFQLKEKLQISSILAFGYYDQYAARIIRSRNCITLLSNELTINKETFWHPNYFQGHNRICF